MRPFRLLLTAISGGTFGAGAEPMRVLGTYATRERAEEALRSLIERRPDLAYRARVRERA